MSAYDFIIVGGGSAGAALAARLAEGTDGEVLLLEAGGTGRNPLIRMPAGVLPILASRRLYQWPGGTEPQSELAGRTLYYPRGRVLGGGSSINGAMWVRGHPADYDEWDVEGWRFDELLPFFKRSESWSEGPTELRGGEGPVKVTKATVDHELSAAFCAAGESLGWPKNADFNGEQQLGVGSFDFSVAGGIRMSTAETYLQRVRHCPNLTVHTRSQVSRVVFDGDAAVGVEVAGPLGTRTVHARQEVIVCAGAIGSPQLLMRSGVGSASDLESLDIPVVANRREVGANLQDHLQVSVHATCREPVTLHSLLNLRSQLGAGARWLFSKTGPATNIGVDCGAFLRSSHAPRPDLQLNFMRASLLEHGRKLIRQHSFMCHACILRPKSRGYVALKSADPSMEPVVQPNFLRAEEDMRILREGVEQLREWFAHPQMSRFYEREMLPGADKRSRQDLEQAIREQAESVFHPVGTCRMGTDPEAVVDPALRVNGIRGLRVADASIMPDIPAGNTNAPTIAVAEKAANILLSEC